MIIGLYLIVNILIEKILLQPKSANIIHAREERLDLQENLRFLSSLIFCVFFEYIEQLMKTNYGIEGLKKIFGVERKLNT